jgi:hypothetical protein
MRYISLIAGGKSTQPHAVRAWHARRYEALLPLKKDIIANEERILLREADDA